MDARLKSAMKWAGISKADLAGGRLPEPDGWLRRLAIIKAYRSGVPWRVIAEQMGLPCHVVDYALRRFVERGHLSRYNRVDWESERLDRRVASSGWRKSFDLADRYCKNKQEVA